MPPALLHTFLPPNQWNRQARMPSTSIPPHNPACILSTSDYTEYHSYSNHSSGQWEKSDVLSVGAAQVVYLPKEPACRSRPASCLCFKVVNACMAQNPPANHSAASALRLLRVFCFRQAARARALPWISKKYLKTDRVMVNF